MSQNIALKFTMFDSVTTPKGKLKEADWLTLVKNITNPKTYLDKKHCPLIKLATFNDNFRNDSNLHSIYGIEGDYDAGKLSIDEASALIKAAGIEALLYTTPSNTTDKPRWRVIAPFSATIAAKDRGAHVAVLNGVLGGVLSPESFTPSQAFYCGKVDGAEYRAIHVEGITIDGARFLIEQNPVYPSLISSTQPEKQALTEEDKLFLQMTISEDTFNDLRSALVHIAEQDYPGSTEKYVDNRDEWVRCGQALSTLGDRGKELWLDWSKKSHKFNERDAVNKWKSFKGDSTSYEAIFKKAQVLGWVNPKSNACASSIAPVPDDWARFSITGKSAKMRQEMLEDKFVMKDIAIRGQFTVIYAKPNTGKTLLTLKLITEAIASGEIKGNDVYYINADDTKPGLVVKTETAERFGFEMIAPGYEDFKPDIFISLLQKAIDNDSARGKVVILDTLKKFADLMDKKSSTEFMKVARGFISKGGTVVGLAHVNKNRNAEGKVVHAGTTDIIDDSDCAFMLDESSSSANEKVVTFTNEKMRGNVKPALSFSYSTIEGQNYEDIFNSVKLLDRDDAEKAKLKGTLNKRLEKDLPVINAINEELKDGGEMLKDKLVKAITSKGLAARRAVLCVLTNYEGHEAAKWMEVKRLKNEKVYQLKNDSDPFNDLGEVVA